MARATISLEGVDDLKRKLRGKIDEYQGALEGVVSEAADAVREDWRAHAAVDDGDYQDSIGVRQEGLMAEVGNFDRKGRHGIFPEFGTSSQPAQPAAQPAAELERNRFPDRVREAIRDHS